jgi:hypothetical protein
MMLFEWLFSSQPVQLHDIDSHLSLAPSTGRGVIIQHRDRSLVGGVILDNRVEICSVGKGKVK